MKLIKTVIVSTDIMTAFINYFEEFSVSIKEIPVSKEVILKLGNAFLNLSDTKILSTSYLGSNSSNSRTFLLKSLASLNYHKGMTL